MTTAPTVRFLDRTTPPHIVTLILMAGISALNMSIFLPSLNQMTADFDTTYATMQLSVSAYLAATAVMQVFIGPLSDKIGRRKVMIGGLAIFVLATMGAYFATTVETFLIFRILQAAVASGMALSRAIVRDMVPQDQAASMIGYVTMGMALVPMIGPTIGGVLDQFFGWHATFLFLAAVGVAVMLLCILDQGETVRDGGMSFGDQIAGYPALFASPRFWGYALCMAFGSGAFFALLGGASFIAEGVFGMSPIMSGFAIGAPAVGYAAGNFISGRYAVRFGVNAMALTGMLLTSGGLGVSLVIALLGYQSPLLFFGFCLFLGFGNGLMLPNATAGLLSVRPHLAGTASGLGGALMIGGGAALSQFAGGLLTLETGTLPLQWIMFVTSLMAVLCILFVIWRGRVIET
ncbi:MFS transporter, DHA1 family, bicyclomycin/chloramphenicol resistance protein [Cognatiyoonia koreensis]|uniref:Bcr/CflA family efflux transporter n=1 Tax=Cognatiyoonia koreensis TaxID=364200 RepID=A0A1I0QBP2_9RHOB|nr:multidrug effflux MFS transporter [Cognatiyoonia koreensis]SEW24327.1 MFS transporter, DHA1 family, bicyclomycin/chloramphenicol resistance protein [Cognatiyoonia koreensis]